MIYLDPLLDHGWKIRGKSTPNAHLFTDAEDLQELHDFAHAIGLKREWFQCKPGKLPHYDVTPGKYWAAARAGAVRLSRAAAVEKWRELRERDARAVEDARPVAANLFAQIKANVSRAE